MITVNRAAGFKSTINVEATLTTGVVRQQQSLRFLSINTMSLILVQPFWNI